MTVVSTPRDAAQIETIVREALADGTALEIVGRGTKRLLGRPLQTARVLDLSALSGVTLYEPEELVLSARAATPLDEIEALVASKGQELAFEPMNYGPLLGVASSGTIGGTLAVNLSGPRRIKAGAARDHFLGVTAVSGRGEIFKSGGRVVKNVTGYDLCKLLAGSYGTLAVMTDVTVKTLPRAETQASIVILGLDAATAGDAMAVAMNSSCDVSGAAYLPPTVAPALDLLPAGKSATVLRLEGFAPSVAHRREALHALTRRFGEVSVIDQTASVTLWRMIRDVVPFATNSALGGHAVWRISTAPSQGAALDARIASQTAATLIHDWAGGLLWVAVPAPDAGVAVIREAVREAGGHATLVRASAALRNAVDVFEPQDETLAALTRRVKQGFDPNGIFNPGRMWAGV